MLCDMRDLAEILFKKRSGEGSIDFEVPEPHICTDEDGAVLFAEPGERRVANRMIEEFMLEANRVVRGALFLDGPSVCIPRTRTTGSDENGGKTEAFRRQSGADFPGILASTYVRKRYRIFFSRQRRGTAER